jgi:hypothetical protein
VARVKRRDSQYACRYLGLMRIPRPLLSVVICLAMSGCGDDDPVGPTQDEAADVVRSLNPAFRSAVVASLAGSGTVKGVEGQLLVEGSQWHFEGFSPDGEAVIDGELDVDPAAQPMVILGDLKLSGGPSGVLRIELSYNASNGILSGAIAVDGVVVDVSHRLCCPG